MSDYTKLYEKSKINVNIIISSDNFTMTKKFGIRIYYRKCQDGICQRNMKLYQKYFFPVKNKARYVTEIPSGSQIISIDIIIITSKKTSAYNFSFYYSKPKNLNIKFENGNKYPIIYINNKVADTRENSSNCSLM
ncbi:hypothetical protein QJ854_gp010 [Moumouvirus goulette]|uniref:Uncharacterized protein n=1 Tax=Moumouvirus goulette TaxID=1247379 RepID=M1PYB2_9VIRU|nr:hypothetical protein QJ854_gp010 [Moumouvirus goulette]AGF85772.1 hypothetical protein glt_00969 [Moumouvirus goulette]